MRNNMRNKEILYPTDFSPTAHQALAYVVELANLYGADVRVLHVSSLSTSAHFYGISVITPQALEQQVDEFVAMKLDAIGDEISALLSAQQSVSTSVRHGDVVDEILAEALDVGMIVMASNGDTGLAHFLNPQIAEALVNRAQCPVLVVK